MLVFTITLFKLNWQYKQTKIKQFCQNNFKNVFMTFILTVTYISSLAERLSAVEIQYQISKKYAIFHLIKRSKSFKEQRNMPTRLSFSYDSNMRRSITLQRLFSFNRTTTKLKRSKWKSKRKETSMIEEFFIIVIKKCRVVIRDSQVTFQGG